MKDLDEASFILDISIHKDRSRNLLGFSQKIYIERVLKRFNMQDCKPQDVPITKDETLKKAQCPMTDIKRESVRDVPYASVVGSLMHAQVCTRPDIAFAVGLLERFLSNPRHDHWVATKKVLRYLKGTKDYMQTYKRVENLELVGYTNSDYADFEADRKSTSGYIFMLAGSAVSWKSVKQILMTSSTMHTEYITCFGAFTQAAWLHNLITEMSVVDSITRPIQLCYNNLVLDVCPRS